MKMYGIREKETGKMLMLFDDFFKARSSVTNKNTQEVVERIVENDYQRFPDGKVYIVGTHSNWVPISLRSSI